MVKAIAIHLPQFHPVEKNDEWWGKGFTEWTNVGKAVKRFPGHYQPKVPADLGYVDLRLAESRQAQAELARQYGIHGFCYYHYWFEGQRLLERPVNEILASGEPDFPFSLCWANETWSRRWLGEERAVLIKQAYSAQDHQQHALWLCAAFADRRYIRVNGRPLFIIYRPLDIPDLQNSLDIYRTVVQRELGVDLFMVASDSHGSGRGDDFRSLGFDHTLNFRPSLGLLPGLTEDGFSVKRWLHNLRYGARSGHLRIADYAEFDAKMEARRPKHTNYFPAVFVGWDNTARRGENGAVVVNGTPQLFHAQVTRALKMLDSKPADEQFLFVNAWNEWAEGNYLEPDQHNGHAYLKALQAALLRQPVGG